MQCKDIPDEPILRFLALYTDRWCYNFEKYNCKTSVFWAMPHDIPYKVGFAKMNRLIKRGLVDGCPCGCRGDYEITEKGLDYLKRLDEGAGRGIGD
jgi:hypothetical protein